MRPYGLKPGFFGIKKSDIEARLAELKAGQS